VVTAFIDGTTGALLETNCETDFVTKNDSFLAMAKAAAELVAKHNPADVAALGALPYSQDSFGPTLEDVRKGLIGKIGENMTFRRFKRFAATTSWPPTCTARASASWSNSKAMKRRPRRGDARRGDEAGRADQRRRFA
jgi:translation elongation factor EF-Ts